MLNQTLWTIPLFLFTWVAYTYVFISQRNKLEATTARLQVLALRASFCLPFYGLKDALNDKNMVGLTY